MILADPDVPFLGTGSGYLNRADPRLIQRGDRTFQEPEYLQTFFSTLTWAISFSCRLGMFADKIVNVLPHESQDVPICQVDTNRVHFRP